MDAAELTVSITAIANLIARGISPSEIALIASVFVQIGDTLATIAAADALYLERNEQSKE